nr:hypothetical protein [Tanacetum cinerariifolium]
MQTRYSSRLVSNPSSNPTLFINSNPKVRNRRRSKQRIEDFNLKELYVRNKMLKSFPLPVMKFPLPEYFPTTSEEVFPLQSQRDAPAEEVCTAVRIEINRGQRHINISQRCVSVILGMCPMIVLII